MKLTFGGVRGSFPVARASHTAFGGETTALLITAAGGGRLLVDAGTGIRALGERLHADAGDPRVAVFLSHYHLDHVVGLVSLPMLYDGNWDVEILGAQAGLLTPDSALLPILSRPLWPFRLEEYAARIRFSTLTESPSSRSVERAGLRVSWCPLQHRGGSTAFRFDEAATGAALVFATDVEWQASSAEQKEDFRTLCTRPRPVDLLVFDGHFTPEDYERFKGSGHSTWRDAVSVALEVEAGRLLVTHHAPDYGDQALAAIEKEVTAAMPGAGLARQGMEVTVEKSKGPRVGRRNRIRRKWDT